ncbi:MAG: SulP family inorganic anion transporter [Candidatus Scalindua sp. AMX11]|nr:MAG: SulP family inorganic anion transporter [Candidatus Scalindua sp.]NOG82663.1 SulP family inorganic anion transporter [Planctomycetota bacterium]RZV95351.1 MAG: SulP family inorganic anion transporter [Candidatus Scalindua sp. SCAELEC01]TDE66283.1 MAG: SulP family inorganic anion transporter [Candidatus Scalindua sp. AMX11]
MKKKGLFFSTFKRDIPASIVVLFVALPLCLGIALASGAPLFSGLIAGIIGGIVVGAISDSSHGVSGPAAGLAIIILTTLATMPFETFLLAVVIAGGIQLIFGFIRAGIIGYYFPLSAINGMLAGIGIIIFIKQLPFALGYDGEWKGPDYHDYMSEGSIFTALLQFFEHISPGAIIIAVVSMGILLSWELYLTKKYKVFKLIQGPIVVVAAGVICQLITKSYFPQYHLPQEFLVRVPVATGLISFFGHFSFPDFSQIANKEVYILAFTIAIVASLETLLCVEATDKLDPHKRTTSTNRELFAQGAGNIVSGMIGGLAITQVIVRSSANVQAGAESKISAILHGVFLLICVACIPTILNLIPLPALACILLMVGYKLAKPSQFVKQYRLGWEQFVPFIVTILGIVFEDLLIGLALGCGVGAISILIRNYRNSHFLHMETSAGEKQIKISLSEDVTFLNKGAIISALAKIPNDTYLTIDLSRCYSIDYDVREAITDFIISADDRNINVKLIQPLSKSTGKEEIYSVKLNKWVYALPIQSKPSKPSKQ